MFEYFYHEILRRTIISFGSLFNNIEIKHLDSSDDTVEIIKVPLAYGPQQKFLARLEQSPNLNKPVQITLPRMSFEFVGLQYDASRKVTTTQTFKSHAVGVTTAIRKTYMPVPYNMAFELSVYTKLNDDMLQIVEQILPYFQPAYTLSVNLVETLGEKRDIPVVIENITMNDNYEGDYKERRSLLYTIRFTAKTYLFGPVGDTTSASRDLIKRVRVGYVQDDSATPTRDLTYTVVPRATRSYDDNVVTNLAEDVGTTTNILRVNDASGIDENTYIVIDNESIYVDRKEGNTLFTRRAQDNTLVASHVGGAAVNAITDADDALIEIGDDFGFDGTLS